MEAFYKKVVMKGGADIKKIRQVREILEIPEHERIGQYIYNLYESVDIFYISDKDFAKKIRLKPLLIK